MMVRITIVDRHGSERTIAGNAGQSLMEAIRNNGFDELLAICGGSCSCATCHVFLEIPDNGVLPQVSPDEADLLGASDHRRPNSRLSCQILLDDRLDGARATIAPEE